ncbi:aerobactin siderophore biosynthesis protein iucb [Ophiostoma piceae UAMH 11346]|uniref:Aerobactin siderophore biosynthesis protein iucb n=1 Tax=Ophiostoma piceae (strain UAMH 11346) TaxID=1262450 RepID=S3CA16_OPHP1|nr:aerobactin siderophore biosynthesis protein iucb [Ophiostoma piceae UAMH 11346]
MVNSTVYLPDGQSFTVVPVFAGLQFKSNDLNAHHSAYPVGWTVVLHTEDDLKSEGEETDAKNSEKPHVHSFRKPTLQGDSLFISSVSNPSSSDFKPATSPTRQTAMMLWVSLYWYFQQQAPDVLLPATAASNGTPVPGRPRGEWRIRIKREGMLRVRNLIPKLERMGLIATLESSAISAGTKGEDGWDSMFVTRSMFWQIPPQLFLFTLQPTKGGAASGGIGGTSSFPGSPNASRPSSPLPAGVVINDGESAKATSLAAVQSFPIGPFFSTSHLPTYYPPGPLRYTMTGNVRHPARPKPPRMGEVFYTRFVPSVNQYLSLRVASLSSQAVPYMGPKGPQPPIAETAALTALSDTGLMQKWMASPRVSKFWGNWEDDFLVTALSSQHSFPVIAMWDGVPFGYFEIYWVKEDILGVMVGAQAADDFDRGLHVFIGEEWARGRVQQWLSSVVQYILSSDNRTMGVCIEPRVDNTRFIQLLETGGFNKQREVTFKHKQSWFGRLDRDGWQGPAL